MGSHGNSWELFVLTPLLVVRSYEGARIVLLTMQTYSHCLEIASVGQELAGRGHEVAIFLDIRFKHNNCYERGDNGTKKIRSILFNPDAEIEGVQEIQERFIEAMHERNVSPLARFQLMKKLCWHHCAATFSDQTALELLKAEKFDLAIIDGMFVSYCLFVLPYHLGIKYKVAIGSILEDFVSARPFLPSIVPGLMSGYTDRISFFQRVLNGIVPVVMYAGIKWNIPMDVIANIAPELSAQDVINLVSHSELFLYNQDTVLGYSVPKMPNHIYVGGVAAYPPTPLSGVFQEIYQKATGLLRINFTRQFSASSYSAEFKICVDTA